MTRIYYLGVRFTSESNKQLIAFRTRNNLSIYDMPKMGFHTTIIHSKTPFIYELEPFHSTRYFGMFDINLFRESLVLLFKPCDMDMYYSLNSKHIQCKVNGATSEYRYQPHITIAENITALDISTIENDEPFDIEINEIYYKEWNIE